MDNDAEGGGPSGIGISSESSESSLLSLSLCSPGAGPSGITKSSSESDSVSVGWKVQSAKPSIVFREKGLADLVFAVKLTLLQLMLIRERLSLDIPLACAVETYVEHDKVGLAVALHMD